MPPDTYPTRLFKTAAAWDKWLAANYAKAPGIWLRFAKKASGLKSVTYQEALDVALAHGWIDGLVRKYDDDTYIQKFTPRGKRSVWSKINVGKVARLTEAGLMRAGGLAAVEAARLDGRWAAAYDGARTISVPADLEAELKKSARGRKTFDALSAQNRYAVLFRLQSARTPELRAKRLARFVEMLKQGKTLYPQQTIEL